MRDDGFFAQEQWTHKRLTLQGALRFDRAVELGAAAAGGPGRFLPTPLTFPETPVVDSYNDITPRVAAAYDLFGNGKTALKAHVRQVSGGGGHRPSHYASGEPDLAHRPERHPHVDRRQRQLRPPTAIC